MPPAAPELTAADPPQTSSADPPRVETPEHAAPVIRLPADRAEAVSRALTAAGVRHWVQNPYPGRSGGWKRKILLTYAADVAAVQAVLNGMPGA